MQNVTPEKIKEELREFLSRYFAGRKFFSVIYGSYAYGTQRASSDVDVIICVEHLAPADTAACVAYVIDFHRRYGMGLDFEIKHENKLVVDYSFMTEVVRGDGFKNEQGKFCIPEIVKTPEYLNSKPLLLRFFLDSMVHKHLFLAGNEADYAVFRQSAVEKLMQIILVCNQIKQITPRGLVDEFIYHQGVTGDYYLGFEDKPYYCDYLETLFAQEFKKLLAAGKVTADATVPELYVLSTAWLASGR